VKVLVEGPRWAGMWTEAVVDAIEGLGWRAVSHYHNVRGPLASLSNRLRRATGRSAWLPTLGTSHAERSNARLRERLDGGGFDVLLSIQGKLDRATIAAARSACPGLRVVF